MGKMTNSIIEQLYLMGRKVYEQETMMSDAVNEVMNNYGDSIAKSSAEFYIGLIYYNTHI